MPRSIGIDYGAKKIGIAISDPLKIIVTPLTTLETCKKLELTAQKLANFIHQQDAIDEIIIGLPYHMNGKVGVQADEVKQFITLLAKHVSIPIITWDERLTTLQATRTLKEAKLSRKKQSKVIDKLSAVIILQNYLSAQENINQPSI